MRNLIIADNLSVNSLSGSHAYVQFSDKVVISKNAIDDLKSNGIQNLTSFFFAKNNLSNSKTKINKGQNNKDTHDTSYFYALE